MTLHVADLVLHVNDWDDEGTVFDLTGRGAHVSTYSIWDVRASIMARLTPEERERLKELPFASPEHVVTRIVMDRGEIGDPDFALRPTRGGVMEGGHLPSDPLDAATVADKGVGLASDLHDRVRGETPAGLQCKVEGCERPYVKRKGKFGLLCSEHIEERKAERKAERTPAVEPEPKAKRKRKTRKPAERKFGVRVEPEHVDLVRKLDKAMLAVDRARRELQSAEDELEGVLEDVRRAVGRA